MRYWVCFDVSPFADRIHNQAHTGRGITILSKHREDADICVRLAGMVPGMWREVSEAKPYITATVVLRRPLNHALIIHETRSRAVTALKRNNAIEYIVPSSVTSMVYRRYSPCLFQPTSKPPS